MTTEIIETCIGGGLGPRVCMRYGLNPECNNGKGNCPFFEIFNNKQAALANAVEFRGGTAWQVKFWKNLTGFTRKIRFYASDGSQKVVFEGTRPKPHPQGFGWNETGGYEEIPL